MGLHGPVSRDDVACVETFYAARGVPSEIEIASMVDRSLLRVLGQRGYHLVRFRNMYAQALPRRQATASRHEAQALAVEVHTVDESTATEWSTLLLDGFAYTQDADRHRVSIWNQMVRSRPNVTALIARLNHKPVGAASVMVVGEAAVLGGVVSQILRDDAENPDGLEIMRLKRRTVGLA